MGYYDYTNYTNSLLISYLVLCEIMHVMSDFFVPNVSSSRAMKGQNSIRGSGPLTVDRPWKAAVIRGRGW